MPYTEWLTATPIWNVFIAIPFLVLSYLLGLVLIRLSATIFDSFRKETVKQRAAQIINISAADSGFISSRYEQLLQDMELLQAACPAVALLGVAILSSLRLAGGFPYARFVFGLFGFLLVAFVPLCLFLISKTRNEMVELSKQAGELKAAELGR